MSSKMDMRKSANALSPIEFMNFVKSSAEKRLHEAISQFQIDYVRKVMAIGDFVTFKIRSNYFGGDTEEIGGTVKAKSEHVFVLENGHSYRYVDYILGNQYVYHKSKRIEDQVSARTFYYADEKEVRLSDYKKEMRSAIRKESRDILSSLTEMIKT